MASKAISSTAANINSYYDDPHNATGHFDFVLANPPFNVNAVDKERLKDMPSATGRRFPFGLPRTDNANYLWINLFPATSLKAERPRRARHGQLRFRCAPLRGRYPSDR